MKPAWWEGGERYISDYSVFTLLAANLLTIVIAVLEHWDLGQTLFIYWVQSVTIGVFAAVRMLLFRTDLITNSPSFQKFLSDKRTRDPAEVAFAIKIFMAGFFSVHYGLFHYGYFEILSSLGLIASVSLSDPSILMACGGFAAHHGYSFFYHRRYASDAGEYLQETFFFPYHRIIPMHATIIFGGIVFILAMIFSVDLSMSILVFFLVMKTGVDVRMHVHKHRQERDNPPGHFPEASG